MNRQEIEVVNELALVSTQQELDALEIKLSLNFLSEADALQIESLRGKVLDWSGWFQNEHENLTNKFTLSVSSKGRPPITIGAAVFSYDMENQLVNIHMIEHFKRQVHDDHLVKRMGFVALNVALVFARTAKASVIRVVNPLPYAVPYYKHLSFDFVKSDLMESTLQNIDETLRRLKESRGQHDFEADDD
ncbi:MULTISPECIES: hypothetical protein [unclassified Citrobacter]|uniref:hypothetical protein n=1 Tax=unclassified Citrobacter TaxID=2644389 RepID=UPI000AC244A3|nr:MULTISPECIES: hypothetical protein [unclassified Citrobacter]MDM3001500.1 hypothetical protein [Citrobacter sp. CK192]MDM3022951.1 hypothetical protein [Citrobacter sp. CK193]MDU4402336.1 hypothetical protein [Citrobacter koseri]DAL19359.1 MAG TPA_asm: hypothetical protein [Caudoviricetes sp.]